jgi:uncharacterized OB-fold protein
MRSIVGGAVYRPAGGAMAADEDEFTVAVTAVERLGAGDGAPRRLTVVGTFPRPAEEDLARFSGAPLPGASDAPVRDADLGAALRSCAASPPADGSALVVAFEREAPELGALAVALRLDAAGEPHLDPASPEFASVVALVRRISQDPAPWPGSGDLLVPAVTPGDRNLRPELPAGAPVAQGAYVPWPRYVESVTARWRLVAERCAHCGALTFPPRGRCRACEATGPFEEVPLDPDSGRAVASTRIGPGGQPTEFDDQVAARGPYGVVLVEFAPGVRGTFQVADGSVVPVPIDARVSLRMRRAYPMEGRWRYARKAVLAGPSP